MLYVIQVKDKIPLALMKMSTQPLSTPGSIAMNTSFQYNIFPCTAKVAFVKPLGKKTEGNYCISIFC